MERHAADGGRVTAGAVEDFVREHELGPERLADLYDRLEERGVECEDCGREDTRRRPRYELGDLSHHTTDALQLFLNEAGRYRLLTPAEEIELAKRIERGDLAAKDHLINAQPAPRRLDRPQVPGHRRADACSTSSRRACSG